MLGKRSRLQWIIQILLESATCCISKWICGEQSCGPENQEKELRDTKVFRIAERKWRFGDTSYFDPLLIVFLVFFLNWIMQLLSTNIFITPPAPLCFPRVQGKFSKLCSLAALAYAAVNQLNTDVKGVNLRLTDHPGLNEPKIQYNPAHTNTCTLINILPEDRSCSH